MMKQPIRFFLLSAFLSSTVFANRIFISAPYSVSFTVRPGPAIDESGFAPGGVYANNPSVNPESQSFGRIYNLSLSNISKIPQRLTTTMVVTGVSWKAPTPTKVGVLLTGPNFNKADEGTGQDNFNLESSEFEIPAGGSINLRGAIAFYGKTKYTGIYFTANAAVGFKFNVKDDLGAITASVSSSPAFSNAGNNGVLTSADFLDAAMISASFAHFTSQINGGRAF